MHIVMISGAQNYEGLLRDFIAWRETGKQPPSVILTPHGFTEETLRSTTDPRRLSWDKRTGRVFVNLIPVVCLCEFMGDEPGLFDCPTVVQELSIAREVLGLPVEDPSTHRVAKKAAKKAAKKVAKKAR